MCMDITTAVAGKILDAKHAEATTAITNLLAIAETAIEQGDADAARDCLAEVAELQAFKARIESCWIAA